MSVQQEPVRLNNMTTPEITSETELNLTLTLQISEINLIIAGLLEMPAKLSNPLIQKISEEANRLIDIIKTTSVTREGNELSLDIQDSINSKEHFN